MNKDLVLHRIIMTITLCCSMATRSVWRSIETHALMLSVVLYLNRNYGIQTCNIAVCNLIISLSLSLSSNHIASGLDHCSSRKSKSCQYVISHLISLCQEGSEIERERAGIQLSDRIFCFVIASTD
jgi:hypothetical protein